ncbi:nucleotidyltransferase domain-containing protein [Candidatus Pacearchaeota archaeon]|nr:nucleotidyltransferase domain-containing protein [Candidatus Pacearchaeota archaeon]
MDQYTNKRVMELLNQYLKKVNKKFKIEKAILFGSRAKDDWVLNSDVDLVLISKDFENIPFRKRMSKVIGYWDEYIDLEVICYTHEEFNRLSKMITIAKEAKEKGIVIF